MSGDNLLDGGHFVSVIKKFSICRHFVHWTFMPNSVCVQLYFSFLSNAVTTAMLHIFVSFAVLHFYNLQTAIRLYNFTHHLVFRYFCFSFQGAVSFSCLYFVGFLPMLKIVSAPAVLYVYCQLIKVVKSAVTLIVMIQSQMLLSM